MIDDDRLIDVVGAVVVLLIVVAVAVLVLAGATAPSREPAEPPNATWSIERVDAGHVNVTHAGGEPVDASKLVVAVSRVEHGPGRSDTLTNGESITVPARPGQEVQLFWIGARDERTLLAEWKAP
jgi:hypothetical protein